MRSVASCGGAAALDHLGLTNGFDSVYGSSSGALNAAYFLAGQAALGVTVYLEDVNNKRFLNLLRVRKMIDLEYLFDQIVRHRKKHDYSALVSHPTELNILATDLDAADTVWFGSKDPGIDLYTALKASCALPIIYGQGVHVGDRRCVDGYFMEPMPMITALGRDYTDILVLMSRNIGSREKPWPGSRKRFIFELLVKLQLPDELFVHQRNHWKKYNDCLDLLEAGYHQRSDGHSIRLAYVCPDADAETGRFEFAANRLRASGVSAWKNTMDLFGASGNDDVKAFDQALQRAKSAASRPTAGLNATPL